MKSSEPVKIQIKSTMIYRGKKDEYMSSSLLIMPTMKVMDHENIRK